MSEYPIEVLDNSSGLIEMVIILIIPEVVRVFGDELTEAKHSRNAWGIVLDITLSDHDMIGTILLLFSKSIGVIFRKINKEARSDLMKEPCIKSRIIILSGILGDELGEGG
jgi:hypothetical protein